MLSLISDIYLGSQTITQIISGMGVVRAVVISVIKILWILVYLGLRKFLQRLSINMKEAYLILVTSGVGFLGFVF